MKSKFKVGDYVNFEELTGEIVEVNKYNYESSFYYKIKVSTPCMKNGYSIFERDEEELQLYNR